MATQLTAEDAKQSLTAHVEAKGIEVFVKYGPQIGWGELQCLLADRAFVRYPCRIEFDAATLLPGEFAHPVQQSAAPEDGFTMFVHPRFMLELNRVAWLVLYQLVAVNYGEFASADEAETFGAAALGLTRDEYYAALCAMADEIGGSDMGAPAASPAACGMTRWEPQACGCGGDAGCHSH
jgi:hypothetical protein